MGGENGVGLRRKWTVEMGRRGVNVVGGGGVNVVGNLMGGCVNCRVH